MENKSKALKCNPNALNVEAKPGEDEGTVIARTLLRPSVKGAVTIKEYSKAYGDLDLVGLVAELSNQVKAVNNGDLKTCRGDANDTSAYPGRDL